jgi:hypothetical protein
VSIKLVHSDEDRGADIQRRIVRLQMDIRWFARNLSDMETRAIYDKLEHARDALSRILDHADGKHA